MLLFKSGEVLPMKIDRNVSKAAYAFVALVVCSSIVGVLMSNGSSTRPAVVIQESAVVTQGKEWVKQRIPSGGSSGVVIFGKNGDTVVAGRGRFLVSHDHGKTWSKLEGGDGSYRVTTDGGLTYSGVSAVERRRSSSSWIGIDELCSVETGAITNSGRLYLMTVCEDTAQMWSIPISAPGPWFVTGFTYASNPSDGVYGPRPDLIARENLVAVTGTRPGAWTVLTTDDNGVSWKALT